MACGGSRDSGTTVPQGLKPHRFLRLYGTTEGLRKNAKPWAKAEVSSSARAKAHVDFGSIFGTTEVVPCYRAKDETSISATCEVVPFQNRTPPQAAKRVRNVFRSPPASYPWSRAGKMPRSAGRPR